MLTTVVLINHSGLPELDLTAFRPSLSMSLSTPITGLTDGTTDHSYDRKSTSGSSSIWRDDTNSTLALEQSLNVAHSVTGSGLKEVQRSNIGLSREVQDADGNIGVIRCYNVMSIPLQIATEAQVLEVQSQLNDFLATGTNAAEIVRRSI